MDGIFSAMSECQALHPDPEDEDAGEMYFNENAEELATADNGDIELTAEGLVWKGVV